MFIGLVSILIYQYFMSCNFLTGIFGEDRGSSSRQGLGGSVCVLGVGLIKAWVDVARARDTGAK